MWDFSNTLDPSPHNNDQFRTGSIYQLIILGEAPNIQKQNDGLGFNREIMVLL